MKKPLAFLLAMVMTLSLAACGGNDTKESGADKTSSNAEQSDTAKGTEQAPQEKVDVPEGLVGTWYLLPDGFFDNRGGSSSAAGTSETKTKIISRENAMEFTVYKEGTVKANGKECYLNSSSGKEYNDGYSTFKEYFNFTDGEDSYRIYLNSDSDKNEYVVIEPFGNITYNYIPLYSNQKYSEKTAELSLDNWQDFFEVKSEYKLHKNDWNDFDGVYAAWYFGEKNDIIISDVQNARIAFKSSSTETSMIHFDKNTEEYTFSDAVTESNEPYESESDINIHNTEDSYHKIWVSIYDNYRFLPQKDFKDAGNEYTARVVTNVNVEVTRIMGTITYLTAE